MGMKFLHFYFTLGLILLALFFVMTGCEYEGPTAVWNQGQDLGQQPTITAIDPPNSAGGASVIRIIGYGFDVDSTTIPVDSTVIVNGDTITIDSVTIPVNSPVVYYDDVLGDIISVAPTEITTYRPNISGDSICIKVAVDSAYALATHSGYEIPAVVSPYGKFVTPGGVFIMDFDLNDNLWIMIRKRVFKIEPDEDIIEVVQQDFRGSTSDMKIGPDGNLYMKKSNHTLLYMVDNDTIVEYAAFSNNTSYFDFDENGNIFAGGDGRGVGVVVGDTSYVVGDCEDLNIVCVRVFDGALYMLDDESNVWRGEILDDAGTLADKDLFVDWSASGYAGSQAFCFTFDVDGILYMGTDNSDAMLMFDTNGQLIGPLFKGILVPEAIWLTFDNDNSMYVACEGHPDIEDNLYKVSVEKEGAPYYGRGL